MKEVNSDLNVKSYVRCCDDDDDDYTELPKHLVFVLLLPQSTRAAERQDEGISIRRSIF